MERKSHIIQVQWWLQPLRAWGLNLTWGSPTQNNRDRKKSLQGVWHWESVGLGQPTPSQVNAPVSGVYSALLTAREAMLPYSGPVERSVGYTQK